MEVREVKHPVRRMQNFSAETHFLLRVSADAHIGRPEGLDMKKTRA